MRFKATERWQTSEASQEREEYLLGVAQLLNEPGATDTARWLVLRPILFGLAQGEREAVFHWCEVLQAEGRSGSSV